MKKKVMKSEINSKLAANIFKIFCKILRITLQKSSGITLQNSLKNVALHQKITLQNDKNNFEKCYAKLCKMLQNYSAKSYWIALQNISGNFAKSLKKIFKKLNENFAKSFW